MANWQLVRPLVKLTDQLNHFAPNRDKASDGSIGDFAHSLGKSDHNPDDTPGSNPGWNGDADNIPDVRAKDIDRDLRVPGVTMEDLLAHFLKYCRNGTFWWIRYIIFDGYIYEKYDGNYRKKPYYGANPHDKHMHFSTDRSEAADDANPNYRLEEVFGMAIEDADINKIAIKTANVLGLVVENGVAQVKAGGKDYGSYNGLQATIAERTGYSANDFPKEFRDRLDAQDRLLSKIAEAMGITGS